MLYWLLVAKGFARGMFSNNLAHKFAVVEGAVASVDALCDTLRVDSGEQRPLDDDEVPDDVSTRELIAAALGEAAFPAAASATTFTLPLAFD